MKPTFLWPVLSAAALSLCSCVVAPHQAVFNEADFAWSRGVGSGTVVGRSVHLRVAEDKSLTFYANTLITLVPVNAYTTEIAQRLYNEDGVVLTGEDPRYQKYVRTTRTDGQGRFAFGNLPPGEYYVFAKYDLYQNWNGEYYRQNTPIFTRVTVRNGELAHAVDWNK